MKLDFLVIGGITEDIMFSVKGMKTIKHGDSISRKTFLAFESGNKMLSDEQVVYTGGGGGANAAISISKLGLKTALISSLGNDLTAVLSKKRLKISNVDTSLIQYFPNFYSGLSFIVTGKNENDHVIFTHRAANEKLRLNLTTYKTVKACWLYLSSLSGIYWKDNLKCAFELATRKNMKVAWNPGSTQLKSGYNFLKNYLRKCELLLLNKNEAKNLVKSSGRKIGNFSNLLAALSNYGPRITAVTDGKNGAWAIFEDNIAYEPAIHVKTINSIGAGDAFGSSLAGGLHLFRGDLKKSLKLALIRSGEVVAKVGAQNGLLTLKEVETKYQL